VEELGAVVVSFRLIPTDHEIVAIGADADRFLIHHAEVLAILEGVSQSF
jgi:hypothetical protein